MLEELRRFIGGSIPVNCQRTFLKRYLCDVILLVDQHPIAIIVSSTAAMSFLLFPLVQALLSLLR